MAQILSAYDPDDREILPGRPSVYPWDEWLGDGLIRQLTKGLDFRCNVATMINMTYERAKKRGVKVAVYRHDEETIVIVPEHRKEPKPTPTNPVSIQSSPTNPPQNKEVESDGRTNVESSGTETS